MSSLSERALAAAALGLVLLSCAPAWADGGMLERVVVRGASLEGNLEGDSADRDVFVYLPPSYALEPERRYPVVYALHGYNMTGAYWATMLDAPASIDRAIAAGAQDMIVVMPDAMTLHGGSFYSSSPTIGDWESFVAEDLVAYVDAHYRTKPEQGARGLVGHSMGGYGALRIAMKRPGVFDSVYVMSPCCLFPRGVWGDVADLERVETVEQATALPWIDRNQLAAAAAWAPNPDNPPLYLDLPTRNGEPRQEILAQFTANAPLAMLAQHVSALQTYDALAMDIGDQDVDYTEGVRGLDMLMTRFRLEHRFEVYEGDHVNRIAARFESTVIPFFSKHLAAD